MFLLVFLGLLLISLIIYYLLIRIEYFDINDNLGYKKYIELEEQIHKLLTNKDKSLAKKIYAKVPKDMRWKIHRWSMWDYLPSLDYNYYCNIMTYLGKEKCVPISNKLYCSVNNLYKSLQECENKQHAI